MRHLSRPRSVAGLTRSASAGSFPAFEAQIPAEDRARIAAGGDGQLVPVNISEVYRWTLAPDLPKLRLKAE